MNAPTERELLDVAWKRLDRTADSPACMVLDGPNPLIQGEETKFGPHGYLTLTFEGPNLTERIHLPDGMVILEGQVACYPRVNSVSGREGRAIPTAFYKHPW
jgi:hypothetical protein